MGAEPRSDSRPSDAPRRAGLRVELVTQLGLLMALAVVVVLAALAWSHERTLQRLVGRALAAELRTAEGVGTPLDPGADWWVIERDGSARARGSPSAPLDERSRALAAAAREVDGAVVDSSVPWTAIRFAMPIDARGGVAVARLSDRFSRDLRTRALGIVGPLAVMTLVLFVGVGALLLETRVVRPLQRLARAARALAEGDGAVSVPIEGPAETAALANAFNEMSASLAARSKALEDAVADLRSANAELRQTQLGLARAERLAVVGRLATGVAHEVGNPLGAILAFMELVARDPGIGDASRSHLDKAAKAGERVRRILSQLLDYSRPARGAACAPFDLLGVASECRDLVLAQRGQRGPGIQIEIEPGLPLALGDAGTAAQVVLNLLLNAADACAGSDAPRVVVRLRHAALRTREGDRGLAPARARPDAVECAVLDNGGGVAPEDRDRLFDPFFTTKPPGMGTGLGLATALRLAQEMDGELELASQAAQGFATEFVLRLRAASTPASAASTRVRS